MAAPTITSVTTTARTSTTENPIPVSMPATVASGDLLGMLLETHSRNGQTTPTGWTQVFQVAHNTSNRLGFFVKSADGTEGGTTVNVTTSATGGASAACVFRVLTAEWSGTLGDIEATTGVANTSTPNPSSHTHSAGSDDYLVIAAVGAIDDDETASAYPTDFSDNQTTIASGAGTNNGASVSMASRSFTGATLDPDAFTLTGSESIVAATIFISPAAVGGAVTGHGMLLSDVRNRLVI